ncbi:MAG: RuvX/YqgF family protein, partial [bacterium]|nr:RuvX/YqgF family protein [bacterium]
MSNESTKIYLGVDWGEKRIGLALADGETKMATPFKTVENVDELAESVISEKIDVVVVGKPVSISNSQFSISKQFDNFFNELKSRISVPIELV